MRGIFISYRRDDSEGHAGRLFEDLSAQFGRENVFMDVAGIKKGLDFRRIIDEAVSSCGVLLVLIGKNWLAAADDQGQRRLDDTGDFVRLETAAALKRGIPVIPVLVQGARMPREAELPESLKDLAYRNGTELTHARWESDVKLLIDDLKNYVQEPAAAPSSAAPAPAPPAAPAAPSMQPLGAPVAASASGARRWLAIAAAAILVVAVGFGYSAWQSQKAAQEAVRLANEQAAAEVAAAAARAADEQRRRDQAAAEKAAADKATADKAAADKAAAAEAARLAREKAAADKAVRDHAAAANEQAEAERRARDAELALQKAIADKAAIEKATAARAAADEAARKRAASLGTCLSGYVWREAGANDRVCVSPASRALAAADNQQAAARRQPGGGAYGANTCRQGYVWREAFAGDGVCVTPETRARTADENAKAANWVVR